MSSFDNILGNYSLIVSLRHDPINRTTEMFIGDHWQFIGSIETVFVPVTEDSGYVELHFPNPHTYADQHEDEGAKEWLRWGPVLN